MIRLVLSFSISSAVLVMVLLTARTQSRNFAVAADLDEMMEEREWYERRISGLRETLERFEFDLHVEQNRERVDDYIDEHRSNRDRGED